MRIKSVSIKGFRGFNEQRTIEINEKLTVIYAPNSYGKTSISEALEWLLYGITSKVRAADSKEEYKGSYVNRHFTGPGNPSVSLSYVDVDGSVREMRAELVNGEAVHRYLDGQLVESWPHLNTFTSSSEPFVLQHALKDLLLATPDKRFMGFARILGLDALDQIQKDIVSLCTKPQAQVPAVVQKILDDGTALLTRVNKHTTLASIGKALGKGLTSLDSAYTMINAECSKRVPPGTADANTLPQLLKVRDDAVGRVFQGPVALPQHSTGDIEVNEKDEAFFFGFLDESFIQQYVSLVALRTTSELLERAKFLDVGMPLWSRKPEVCPFCGQGIDVPTAEHIRLVHQDLTKEASLSEQLANARDAVVTAFAQLKGRLAAYHRRHVDPLTSFLGIDKSKLRAVLGDKNIEHYQAIDAAIADLSSSRDGLNSTLIAVTTTVEAAVASVRDSTEEGAVIQALGESIIQYVAQARALTKAHAVHYQPTTDVSRVLKRELDILAGTEEISVLIDLSQGRAMLEAKFKVENVLDGLKELRKTVDQYIGHKVLEAISGALTADVMEWYELIKTAGDPDIHFGGFDLDRTAKGDLKARRVQVKAKSFGTDLVSAVSSLSESKLNALGLCMSIASNVRSDNPFEFLVIDDPIQSLDAEHETQFIGIVRKLVEEHDKQVLLLSHNQAWLNRLRMGCRTLNGWSYEIKGYQVSGPVIQLTPWATSKHRLLEIAAILEDSTASSVRLQQAEEEIRILVCEVTTEIYQKVKGLYKSPNNLNSVQVRKMLVECGVKPGLVDRIEQTFSTTDDAHHAPTEYNPDRQRISTYRSWVQELMNELKG